MTIITDATPSLRFFTEVKDVLYKHGYDSKLTSLYQVRPPNGPWHLGVMMVPRTRTGKHATIELRLDDVSSDGVLAKPRLLNSLTLYPTDSSEIRDNLHHNVESRIMNSPYRLFSSDLAHLVADALDSAGIAEK